MTPLTPTLALLGLLLFLLGLLPVCLHCVEDVLQLLLSQRHHAVLQHSIATALAATVRRVSCRPVDSRRGSARRVLVPLWFALQQGHKHTMMLLVLKCDNEATAMQRGSYFGDFLDISGFVRQSTAPADSAGRQDSRCFPRLGPGFSLPSQRQAGQSLVFLQGVHAGQLPGAQDLSCSGPAGKLQRHKVNINIILFFFLLEHLS